MRDRSRGQSRSGGTNEAKRTPGLWGGELRRGECTSRLRLRAGLWGEHSVKLLRGGAGNHFLCAHKTPADKGGGNSCFKTTRRKKPGEKAQPTKAAGRGKGHVGSSTERSRATASPLHQQRGLPLHLALRQPGRMCFLRGLVCLNLSVILFPLQFLLHAT